MEVKDFIKTKLLQYLSSEISKEELYKWALDLLHKMLKGDIFDRKYLEIWGIIAELTGVNDVDDSYCDELVHQLSETLSGNKCASFMFAIQIPERFVVNNLSHIEKILQKYLVEKHLSKSEIAELIAITQRIPDTCNTLNEILELQILDLLKSGYDFCAEDGSVHINFVNGVGNISIQA